MLYFKENLITLARNAVENKKTEDDIKSLSYLSEIETILQHYNQTKNYDSIYAKQLDKKIRDEYPLIDKLYNLPSNVTSQISNSNSKCYPDEISALDVDWYGILLSVLLKKELIGKIEEALK